MGCPGCAADAEHAGTLVGMGDMERGSGDLAKMIIQQMLDAVFLPVQCRPSPRRGGGRGKSRSARTNLH